MRIQKPASKRHFTEAAKAAAIVARRRKQESAPPKGQLEVFVVRRSVANLVFGWEIRRFGALVIDTSEAVYPTLQDARVAGDVALNSRGPEL